MSEYGREAISTLVDRWLQDNVPPELRSQLTPDMLYPLVDSIEAFNRHAMNWAASIEGYAHSYM